MNIHAQAKKNYGKCPAGLGEDLRSVNKNTLANYFTVLGCARTLSDIYSSYLSNNVQKTEVNYAGLCNSLTSE